MDQDPAEQQEICKRWYQLAAFYPWARTNRDDVDGGIPIEPYELSDDNVEVAVYSIKEKYKFARYMYECLFVASQEGGTCFDPLFYEYPGLDGAYTDIESTFLVGNSVKVSPILKAMGNETIYQSFFPKGKWADLDDYSIIEVVDDAGKMIDLKATTTIKKHLRPGHIIPVQQGNDDVSINSTVQLLTLPVDLIINRDDKK
jgi:alpha-glucosidase